MQHPAVIAEYVRTYIEERRRLAQRVTKDRAQIERRLAQAQRELDRAIKALIKGSVPEEEAEREIAATRIERDRLRAELITAPEAEDAVALHPAALKRYEAALERLQEALQAGMVAGDIEGAEAVRDLVESVTVRPRAGGGVECEISGRLNALLGDRAYPNGIRSISGIDGAQGRTALA